MDNLKPEDQQNREMTKCYHTSFGKRGLHDPGRTCHLPYVLSLDLKIEICLGTDNRI